jgi:hypothetical protein
MGGKERAVFLVVLKDGRSDVNYTLQELQIYKYKFILVSRYGHTADLQR